MNDNERMEKGELILFCKDFKLTVPKSKILEVFRQISTQQKPLEFDQFKIVLPKLGLEYAKAKTREIKNRLNEIKAVIEYPENASFVKLTENLEKLINGVQKSDHLGKAIRIKDKKQIPAVIK